MSENQNKLKKQLTNEIISMSMRNYIQFNQSQQIPNLKIEKEDNLQKMKSKDLKQFIRKRIEQKISPLYEKNLSKKVKIKGIDIQKIKNQAKYDYRDEKKCLSLVELSTFKFRDQMNVQELSHSINEYGNQSAENLKNQIPKIDPRNANLLKLPALNSKQVNQVNKKERSAEQSAYIPSMSNNIDSLQFNSQKYSNNFGRKVKDIKNTSVDKSNKYFLRSLDTMNRIKGIIDKSGSKLNVLDQEKETKVGIDLNLMMMRKMKMPVQDEVSKNNLENILQDDYNDIYVLKLERL